MQMQCRSDHCIPNQCISISVLFAATATNFGANPIKDRMLPTDNQAVAKTCRRVSLTLFILEMSECDR